MPMIIMSMIIAARIVENNLKINFQEKQRKVEFVGLQLLLEVNIPLPPKSRECISCLPFLRLKHGSDSPRDTHFSVQKVKIEYPTRREPKKLGSH